MVIEAFMKAYESVKGFFGIKFLGGCRKRLTNPHPRWHHNLACRTEKQVQSITLGKDVFIEPHRRVLTVHRILPLSTLSAFAPHLNTVQKERLIRRKILQVGNLELI